MNYIYLTVDELFKDFNVPEFGITEKENKFYTWFLFQDELSAGAYICNSNWQEKINHYLFCDSKSLNLSDLDFKKDIAVIGTVYHESDDFFEDGTRYVEDARICHNRNEFIDFFSTLDCKHPIYFFYVEDNIISEIMEKYEKFVEECEAYRMRTVHFDGDVIITDPCYIEGDRDLYDDTDGYFEFKNIGFTSALAHDTLYGDWSCTTYNSDTKESIGRFCADSGMVGVFLLDEVLKYNPSYTDYERASHTVTLIKDFHGDICFEKIDKETLIVKGVGNINFETRQTGF